MSIYTYDQDARKNSGDYEYYNSDKSRYVLPLYNGKMWIDDFGNVIMDGSYIATDSLVFSKLDSRPTPKGNMYSFGSDKILYKNNQEFIDISIASIGSTDGLPISEMDNIAEDNNGNLVFYDSTQKRIRKLYLN